MNPRHTTVILFHHGGVTLVAARGDLLRPGSAGIVARFIVCVVDLVCWIVVSSQREQVAGPLLLVVP